MFIIVGSRNEKKHKGRTQNVVLCPACNQNLKYELIKQVEWFTLFTARILPLETTYLASCPYCERADKLPKARFDELLRYGEKDKIRYI